MQDNEQSLGSELRKRYEILEKLGAGGFGTIYKARQVATGQTVAIKELHLAPDAPAAAREKRLARFQREMQLCARVRHPNIVRLIDSGRAETGDVYTVFEYAPGKNLAQVLAEEGALEPGEAKHLMSQLLDALASAHTLGVIHRDFKPANIMVVPTGARRNALVVDFGIGVLTEISGNEAVITVSHDSIGTPAYAAPEQLRGLTPAPRSDLYAWGLIFLECLTGRRVIEGATPADVIFKQLSPEPIPVPSAIANHPLGALLRRVTMKDAEARNVTAEGLLKELEAIDMGGLDSLSANLKRLPQAEGDLAFAETSTSHQTAPAAERLIEGERRQITALCCGISVTSLAGSSVDAEELDHLLGVHQDACTAMVRRFDGLMAGALGNTVLFYFGYPTAREDDARRAAKAALEILAELTRRSAALEKERHVRLTTQIGLHTGMVVARELRDWTSSDPGYVVGSTPKTAAQICAQVPPGAIAVSRESERLLRKHFLLEPLGTPPRDGAGAGLELFQLREETPSASLAEASIVGRERELEALLSRWSLVCGGTGQGMLLSGEPGIGKSRLAREFHAKLQGQPHTWLECRCVPTHAGSPFYPIIDLLEHMLDPSREAEPQARLAKLEEQLTLHGFDLKETMPLLAPLLSLPLPARWPPLEVSAQKMRELTRNAILSLFFEMAERAPVVLLIEDLHWADPSTLELLNQLQSEVSSARLLALCSARPEFTPTWANAAVFPVPLGRLGRTEIERMSLGLTQGRQLPPEVLNEIALRTDGVPLFIEEFVQTMSESGALVQRDDKYVLTKPLADIAIPSTLRDLLTARLDRLGRAKETAQVAAAIGREFTADLLRAVSPLSEAALEEDLDKLVSAELVSRRRRLKSAAYLFKHALIRDAAYDSMLKRSRQQVHARIVKAMESQFPQIGEERPELLAHHHAHAEQWQQAIGYGEKAAMLALQRSANQEAIVHSKKTLTWLESIKEMDAPARAQLELSLHSPLISALMAVRGWVDEEVRVNLGRSQELLDRLGDVPQTIPTLCTLTMYHHIRGHRDQARELAGRLLNLGKRLGEVDIEVIALPILGQCLWIDGDFAGARPHFEHVLSLYDPVKHRKHAVTYGIDARIYAEAGLSEVLWFTGSPDQALERTRAGVAWAQELNHAGSISVAWNFLSVTHQHRGERTEAAKAAQTALEIAERYGLEGPLAYSRMLLASANGQADAMRQIVTLVEGLGFEMGLSYYRCLSAELDVERGDYATAMKMVQHTLKRTDEVGERYCLAEALRLEGLCHRGLGHPEESERSLLRSIEVARRQGVRTVELRATVALCRGLAEQGQTARARDLLSPLFASFSEGLGTTSLTEAGALLRELSR